jgi:UDP-N-acetylglucosamine--N-acetylmuramyl-(pentapeptide) pyrophosphoryl-undecaprenol N-acetylglucosamine transferase
VRVLISGGGTGGHVYPLLAVVEALTDTQAGADTSLLYVGSPGGMEEAIIARTDIAYRAVDSAPVRGAAPLQLLRNVSRLWRGYRQSRALLAEWPPDVVLVSGAYVCVPVALAAWRTRIPVLVYLPDREPGLAVRLLSWVVDRIAVSFAEVANSFPAANRKKVWVSGYPVRAALLQVGSLDRASACSALDIDPTLKTLLVLGGSHGARSINQALVAALPELLPHCQVVHIAGRLDGAWAKEERSKLPVEMQDRYRPWGYMHEELPAAMAAAHLVVARAGAATLAEFPAVGLPSVLVPYPHSGQHQGANADFMVGNGASCRLDDADLSSELASTVLGLLKDEQRLQRMRESALALAKPDAAACLARELHRLAAA